MPIAPLCRWASLPSVRREPVRDESRDFAYHAKSHNDQSATFVNASTQTIESSFASESASLSSPSRPPPSRPPPPPPPMDGLAVFKPSVERSAELNALNANQGSKRKQLTPERETIWGAIAKHIQHAAPLKSTSRVEPTTQRTAPIAQSFLFDFQLRPTGHALFQSRAKSVTCDK